MTTTTITHRRRDGGTMISPFADGFLTRLEMTKSQSPAWQQECLSPLSVQSMERWTISSQRRSRRRV